MPKRKSRRTKSKPTLSWRKLFAYFIPLFLGIVIFINQTNGRSVLGEKDTNFFNFGKKETASEKPKPKPACNRVTSFSASTICERNTKEKSNNAFSSYSYTCEDGTAGSVALPTGAEKKCLPIEKAYELARKACNRKCVPSKTPTPSNTPAPSESSEPL